MNRKFAGLLIALLVFGLAVQGVEASWYLNRFGQLVFEGQVLGDDDGEVKEDNSGKGSSDDREEDREDEKNEEDESDEEDESEDEPEDDDDEDDESEVEFRDSRGNRVKVEIRGDEIKREVKFSDGSEARFELRSDEVSGESERLRFEYRDGKLVVKQGDDENETEVEVEDEFEIEDDENEDRVRVRAEGDGVFVFARGRAAARTNFPLSVDTETNELIVTTPAGSRVVTVLPNAAVANMLAANVIDDLVDDDDASGSGEIAGVDSVVELEDDNGELVYEIEGIKEKRLLGILPVDVVRTVKVSAETGEFLGQRRSVLNALLDMFSL